MKRLTWLVTLIAILLPAGLALACPTCKESIPNSDAESAGTVPGGFNLSVYYMLAGVFITAGLVIGVAVKGIRSSTRMPDIPEQ
jgi:hypothetical protein